MGKPLRIFVSNKERPITLWDFEDAPQEYRDLSENGGDEDYVALVPKECSTYVDHHPIFNALHDSGSWFGCCCIDHYTLQNGDRVYIGAHA